MINKFMNWLVPKLEEWCIRTNRMITISGTDDPENVYFRRMFLFRSKYFSVYIHRFMRSDKDDFHDHPFNFWTYIVSGGYKEEILDKVAGFWNIQYNKPGDFLYRKAKHIHRVKMPGHYLNEEYKYAPLTIIFRGPYIREWGFYKNIAPNGFTWTKWNEYLNVPASDKRE